MWCVLGGGGYVEQGMRINENEFTRVTLTDISVSVPYATILSTSASKK